LIILTHLTVGLNEVFGGQSTVLVYRRHLGLNLREWNQIDKQRYN